MKILFLMHFHTFRKTSYESLLKKSSSDLNLGAGVKLSFENREFSCFSIGVRISKIHNSKTIRDKENLKKYSFSSN